MRVWRRHLSVQSVGSGPVRLEIWRRSCRVLPPPLPAIRTNLPVYSAPEKFCSTHVDGNDCRQLHKCYHYNVSNVQSTSASQSDMKAATAIALALGIPSSSDVRRRVSSDMVLVECQHTIRVQNKKRKPNTKLKS